MRMSGNWIASCEIARAKDEQDVCGPKPTEQSRIDRWRRCSGAQITVVAGMSGQEVRLVRGLIGGRRIEATVADDTEGVGGANGLCRCDDAPQNRVQGDRNDRRNADGPPDPRPHRPIIRSRRSKSPTL